MNFKAAVTEMHQRIPSKLIAEHLGSAKHTLGTTRVVGMSTSYGLDGPWIDSRSGRDFLHPSKKFPGPTQSTLHWVTVPFPWGNAIRAWL